MTTFVSRWFSPISSWMRLIILGLIIFNLFLYQSEAQFFCCHISYPQPVRDCVARLPTIEFEKSTQKFQRSTVHFPQDLSSTLIQTGYRNHAPIPRMHLGSHLGQTSKEYATHETFPQSLDSAGNENSDRYKTFKDNTVRYGRLIFVLSSPGFEE